MKAKKEALEGLEGVKLEESVKIQVKIEGNGVKLEEMVEELKTDVSEEFVEVDAPKSVEMKRKIGLEDLGSVRVHRTRSKKVKR